MTDELRRRWNIGLSSLFAFFTMPAFHSLNTTYFTKKKKKKKSIGLIPGRLGKLGESLRDSGLLMDFVFASGVDALSGLPSAALSSFSDDLSFRSTAAGGLYDDELKDLDRLLLSVVATRGYVSIFFF